MKVVEKPKSIGMIIPHVNYLTNLNYITKKHGGLLPNQWPPRKIEHLMCKDGTEIYCLPTSKNLRGYKFDELWMESLPSN